MPRKPGPGRRSKLTPAIHRAIVKAVATGMHPHRAAALVQISEATIKEWLARGEGRHSTRPAHALYRAFWYDIHHAVAEDERRRIARIEQAGQGGAVISHRTVEKLNKAGEVIERITEVKSAAPEWQADAWHLERSQPDVWGRRERLDIRLSIDRAAERVAADLGMTKEEVLAEAESLLQEMDQTAGQ